ncbi:MAG: PEP-CTERM sorting domain-containing protein [Opitutales bacterium]
MIVENEVTLIFSVEADVLASLVLEFDGDTNLNQDDTVVFRLQRIDGSGSVLETLFSAFADAQDGGDSVMAEVNLLAGETYRVFCASYAISQEVKEDSFVEFTLTEPEGAVVPEPSQLPLVLGAAVGVAWFRRRPGTSGFRLRRAAV